VRLGRAMDWLTGYMRSAAPQIIISKVQAARAGYSCRDLAKLARVVRRNRSRAAPVSISSPNARLVHAHIYNWRWKITRLTSMPNDRCSCIELDWVGLYYCKLYPGYDDVVAFEGATMHDACGRRLVNVPKMSAADEASFIHFYLEQRDTRSKQRNKKYRYENIL
jgi:hypothetical protein